MRRSAAALLALAAACSSGRTAPPAQPAPSGASAAAAPAAATPSTLRYGAGTARYQLQNNLHQVVDMMGQVNEGDVAQTYFVSTALGAQEPNLALAITIDSATVTSSSPFTGAQNTDQLRGRSFTVVVTPRGDFVSLGAVDSTVEGLAQVAENLKDLLPELPERIAPGAAWSDSTSQELPAPGAALTRFARREHRVVGWVDRDGSRALHLTTTSEYTVSGTGEQQGQLLEFSGGGRSVIDRFVSAAGVFLGGAGSDSSLINVNVVSMGMQVPVRSTSRSSITRLP
jgi:hypothetical protein